MSGLTPKARSPVGAASIVTSSGAGIEIFTRMPGFLLSILITSLRTCLRRLQNNSTSQGTKMCRHLAVISHLAKNTH